MDVHEIRMPDDREIDYTFIIVTFNQEKLVTQALESIKYQINAYGKRYKIQLIIGNDASTDMTSWVINKWLEQNGELFAEVNILDSEKNAGTCRNHVNCIRAIKGRAFREIAGDDILPKGNIFEMMDQTKSYDIVAHVPIYFSNATILNKPYLYRGNYCQKLYSIWQLRFLSSVGCPIVNSVIWKKELLTEDVANYILRYRLVEDRPQWYRIFKDNHELKICFNGEPSLLYRYEPGSVTKSEDSIGELYNSDIKEIYENIEKETDSIWVRLYLKIGRKWKAWTRWNPLAVWLKIKLTFHYPSFMKWYKETIEIPYEENQQYLNNIAYASDCFLRELKNTNKNSANEFI